MTREMSLYLDLIRFLAALVVVVVHSYGMGMTGGFLWQLAEHGQTAVMVFFVLSGYVISFVSSTKEKNIVDYSYARLSRLYSVVVPALIITILCNEIGSFYIKEEYTGPWDNSQNYEYLRYVLTFFMLQDLWGLGLSPANNLPFWSISFEVVYYVMFALLFYVRALITKIFFIVMIAILSGPTVVALFPIWLLGWCAYKAHSRSGFLIKGGVCYILFFGGMILLIFSPMVRGFLSFDIEYIDRKSLGGDYVDALAFFVHLLSAPFVIVKVKNFLFKFKKEIIFLGGLTFPLYLFHLPLVRFFAGVSPFISEPSSVLNRLFVFIGLFSIVCLFGLPCDKFKRYLNKLLRACVCRFSLLARA